MGRRNQPDNRQRPTASDKGTIYAIIQTDNPFKLVEEAERLGEALVAVGLKTNQIRNIFGVARQLQAKWINPNYSDDPNKQKAYARGLVLLIPKLAYQQRREPAVEPLGIALRMAIEAVFEGIPADDYPTIYQRFIRFMEFFEAILAYHTAAGGRAQ